MKKRIFLYELEGYLQASEEKRNKLRIPPEKYFDLEGLPSDEVRELLEAFIWERGKNLAPSSLASELLYFNNIREFLIARGIMELRWENAEQIILQLKAWMLENGYALYSQKYRPLYGKTASETSNIEKYMRRLLAFVKVDERAEQEKDIWDLSKFDFPLRKNPIKETKTLNFTRIQQPDIQAEVKKAVYFHLKRIALGSILTEVAAINRFSKYLVKKRKKITSLRELERKDIEDYLIYLQTEATERKSFRSDLYSLRRIIETIGNLYDCPFMQELFLPTDFPSIPKYQFKFYTDSEIKRLNAYIFQMDEQIARALIIHQMLGTRISDTFTLRTDCLSVKRGKHFVRIDQVKSITYEKAISDELAKLILSAIAYTKKHYGETEYIFVNHDDPRKPYQYGTIQWKVMKMIQENDIRDDHGELMGFGTHIFRHCYGKKLTELHIEDWMIAKLLGHKTLQSVHHYRRIGNKMMAEETRKSRMDMDVILLQAVEKWV